MATGIWPINAERIVNPVPCSELAFMSPVRSSDNSQPLSQPMVWDPKSAASNLQLIDTELHFKQGKIELLESVFQKLSHPIEGSFVDEDIQDIRSKELEHL